VAVAARAPAGDVVGAVLHAGVLRDVVVALDALVRVVQPQPPLVGEVVGVVAGHVPAVQALAVVQALAARLVRADVVVMHAGPRGAVAGAGGGAVPGVVGDVPDGPQVPLVHALGRVPDRPHVAGMAGLGVVVGVRVVAVRVVVGVTAVVPGPAAAGDVRPGGDPPVRLVLTTHAPQVPAQRVLGGCCAGHRVTPPVPAV
jgi:hypothetical protein